MPALRALRAAWPEAAITLIGLPWAATFADRFRHLLDQFVEFPGFPGLPERPADVGRFPAFLSAVQADHYDLAIQLHGSGSIVNPLVALFGARACAGFYGPGDYVPDPPRFLPWPEHGTEVRRLLALAEFLGTPPQGEHLEFPVWDQDRERLRAAAGDLVPGRYACVHPGASVPERRWPADRFAAVAKWLADRGLTVVLTGTAAEAELTRAVAGRLDLPAVELAGRTDLGAAAALLEGARLLVCNDTGVSHLAAALGVPSVVLSTGDNPARWAPADEDRHRVLCDDAGVSVDAVIREAADLLGRPPEP
ncbi:MAG TPA: glycosyltransferase family 9 protein [Gemmataceae bacterium]